MSQTPIVEKLRAQRIKFNLSVRAVAEMTNSAESTTRKVFSGTDTQYNFTMETLQPYIDLFDRLEESSENLKPTGVSADSTVALYERIIMDKNLRIDELFRQIESLETKLSEHDQKTNGHISHLQTVNKVLLAVSSSLLAFLIALLIFDFVNPGRGWITSLFNTNMQAFFSSLLHL